MCALQILDRGLIVTVAVTGLVYALAEYGMVRRLFMEMAMSVPDYSWFDQAPAHCKTRNQLAELRASASPISTTSVQRFPSGC